MSEKLTLDEVMEREEELYAVYIENKLPFVLMPAIDEEIHNLLLEQREAIVNEAVRRHNEEIGVFIA